MSAASRARGSRSVNAPPNSMAAPVPKAPLKRSGIKPLDDLTPGERERFQEAKRRQELETKAAEGGISPYVILPVGPPDTNVADSVLSGVLALGPRDEMTNANMDLIRASVSEADNAAYDFVLRVARMAGVSASDVRLTQQRGSDALMDAINAKGLVHFKHPVLHLNVNDRAMNHNASIVESGQTPVDSSDYTLQSQMLRVPVYHPHFIGGGTRDTAAAKRPHASGVAAAPTMDPPVANPTTGATAIPLPDQGLINAQLIGVQQDNVSQTSPLSSSSNMAGLPGSVSRVQGNVVSSSSGLPRSVGMSPLSSGNLRGPVGSSAGGLPTSVTTVGTNTQPVASRIPAASGPSLISRGPRAQSVLDDIRAFESGEADETMSFEMFRQRANQIEREAGVAARQAFEDAVASDPSNSFANICVEDSGQQVLRREARPMAADPIFAVDGGIGSLTTAQIQAKMNSLRAAGEPMPVTTVVASPTTNIQTTGPDGTVMTLWDAGNVVTNLLRIAFMPGASQANVDALMAAANGGRLPGIGGANVEERSRLLAGKLDELMQFVDTLHSQKTPPPRHHELPDNITLLFISHEMTQAIMSCFAEFRGETVGVPGAQPLEMRARVPLVDLMTHRSVTADFASAVAYTIMFTRGLRGSGRQQEFTLRTIQANYRNTMMRLVQARYSLDRYLSYSAGTISELFGPSQSAINADRGRYNAGPAGAYTDRPTMMYGQPTYQVPALLPNPAPTMYYHGAAHVVLNNTTANPNGGFTSEQIYQIDTLAASARRLLGRH